MVPDLFKRIEISPRISFWISVAALSIVLANNHIYITAVQEREKDATALMKRNIAESETLATRERLLKSWEVALMQREIEVKRLIERINLSKNGRSERTTAEPNP